MNESEFPFQIDVAYFSKEAFFDELAEDGEIAPTQPRGVCLSEMEALEGQKQKYDEKISTSVDPPRSSKRIKFNKKKRSNQEKKLYQKDQIG